MELEKTPEEGTVANSVNSGARGVDPTALRRGLAWRGGRYPRISLTTFLDLRAWISAMFFTFGIMLTVYGIFFVTDEDMAKGAGINLNLWTGVGMIVVAAAFAGWLLARPPEVGEAKIGDPKEDVDYMFLPIRERSEGAEEASEGELLQE